MRILIEGPFKGTYSLAIVNKRIAKILSIDHDVYIIPEEKDIDLDSEFYNSELGQKIIQSPNDIIGVELHIRNTWPPRTENMVGRKNAYVGFAWEETTFPPKFVHEMNKLDFIAVTSDFCARAFRASGVFVPIFNIGNPIYEEKEDNKVYDENLNYDSFQKWMKFQHRILHVSSAFWRKGIDILFQSFCDAFDDDQTAGLLIKTHWTPSSFLREAMEQIKHRNGAERIFILESDITNNELDILYVNSSFAVFPSRGEGFLLPAAEAMIKNIPVIATRFSGQVDFCHPKWSIPIEFRLTRSKSHVASPTALIAEPMRDSLAAAMKQLCSPEDGASEIDIDAAANFIRHAYGPDAYRRNLNHAITENINIKKHTNIGIVTTWGEKCGLFEYAQDMIQEFFNYTDKEKYNFNVYHRDSGQSATSTAVDVQSRAYESYENSFLHMVDDASSENDIVLINHHLGHIGIPALRDGARLVKARGKPFVIIAHNGNDWPKDNLLRELDDMGVIIVVHSTVEQIHLSNCGFNNSWMIEHPVSGKTFYRLRNYREIHKAPRFCTFGFALPHKGYDILVSAFSIVQNRFPDAKLTILASILNSAKSIYTIDLLREQIQYLGLERNITLTTSYLSKNMIANILLQNDVAILPYLDSSEGASGAIRTCIGVGLPITTTNSRIFDNFSNTIPQFQAGNIASCARIMIEMIEEYGLLIKTTQSIYKLKDDLSWSKLKNSFECLFDYVLEKNYSNLIKKDIF